MTIFPGKAAAVFFCDCDDEKSESGKGYAHVHVAACPLVGYTAVFIYMYVVFTAGECLCGSIIL